MNNDQQQTKHKVVSEYDLEIPPSHTADQQFDTTRKSLWTLTVSRHQEENQSKATGPLFFIKMIAKLGMTLSTT